MGALKTGDLVRARVLGFLPGRKAVLDVQGENLVAWSDLPLVRGEIVTAAVESEGGHTRLRLVDDVDPAVENALAETLSRAGIAPDELDLFIARTAHELGLRLDRSLIREIRRYLQAAEKGLETGIVPLRRLKPLVLNFAAARTRDLPASPRVLMAVAANPETRLGTALLRLAENLELLAAKAGEPYESAIEERAGSVRRFFLRLGDSISLHDLEVAINRCGYGFESKLAGRGHNSWDVDAGLDKTDLKGTLLSLWSWLSALEEEGSLHGNEQGYRVLERSRAWCGQVLDVIEGIQVQNLPVSGDEPPTVSYQLPVFWKDEPGSLFLLFSKEVNRFWLEVVGSPGIGGDLMYCDGSWDLTLCAPSSQGVSADGDPPWVGALTEALLAEGREVRVRVFDATPRITVNPTAEGRSTEHVDLHV
jgi:hypothetical protein